MKIKNKTTYNINSDDHIRNIFDGNRYVELGIIDVDTISRLLSNEVININSITFYPILNKGLGRSTHKDASIRNKLPFFFYRLLSENNPEIRLVITYGLYYYRNIDKKDKFAPVIFIPIRMYYENNRTYVQCISKPFENPELYSLIPNLTKQNLTQNEVLNNIYALDNVLNNLLKLRPNSVRIENYLTYVVTKREEIIISKKFFDNKYNMDVSLKKGDYYYSRMLTKTQKEIVDKAIKGENISFSGYSGTGKTTVLKNIIINGLAKKKKMLYVSDSKESIEDVSNFLKENGLYEYCLNMCKYNDTYSDKQVEHTGIVDENLETVKKTVDEETSIIKEFEKILNKNVANFKFVDLLKRFFLINSFDEVKDFKLDSDNFDFLYKNEYQKIYDALVLIDENLKKMKTFKNSVWNQIPYDNVLKNSSEVMTIINQLHEDFIKLQEKEKELENYGIKTVESFTMMRRYMVTIDEMFKQSFPNKWRKDINQFIQAKKSYSSLKEDFIRYEEVSSYMSKTYANLDSINIDDEIGMLYGEFYDEKDNEIIDNIISNRTTVQNNNVNSILETKDFKESVEKIKETIDQNICESDELIDDFRELINIFSNYPLQGKLMNIVINDKEESTILRLENIVQALKETLFEMDELIQLNPKRNLKIIKSGNSKHEVAQKYNQLSKKKTKLEKEYKEITNSSYKNHDKVIETIFVIKHYYKKIKQKDYGKNIIDFITTFGIGNRKNISEMLFEFEERYNKVITNFNMLKDFNVQNSNISFKEKLDLLNKFNQYIIELFKSNDVILNVVLDSNSILSINTYYKIKADQTEYNETINYLRNHKEYKRLYENYYNGELTDYNFINRLILIYNAYNNLFVNSDSMLASLRKMDIVNELSTEVTQLTNKIGENLRLYTIIFKDSVSRYYFSNLEENINHLKILSENEEELNYYLNVTSAIKVLDKYGLKEMIKYISEDDKVTLLPEKFSYLYFKRIIDKVLEGKEAVIKSNNYIYELEDLIEKENQLCKAISENTIRKLLLNVPKQVINRKNNQSYISKAKITLSKLQYAEEYLKENQFDIVLIDDAHMMNNGGFNGLFKSKQMIICGDHSLNKVANRNLISLVTNSKSYVLRKRMTISPRLLTYGLPSTTSPFRINYSENRGLFVIQKDIVDYIYNLYLYNKHVKINWFIKEIEKQYQAYEDIAELFYENNIPTKEILEFFEHNINISDITWNNYIHSDYDIINFEDYYTNDSEIESKNHFEILKFSKYGLIVNDENNLLEREDIDFAFYNLVKQLYNREDSFISTYTDEVSKIVASMLSERGYKVVHPSNGINLSVIKKNTDQLVSIIILYSNGFAYDVKNNYRFLKEVYQDEGHKIIFRTMLDLIDGPKEFIDGLCEAIDG